MTGDILDNNEELTIHIRFRMKKDAGPDYRYIQLVMDCIETEKKSPCFGQNKRVKLYPDPELPIETIRVEEAESGEDVYEYTVSFHPKNRMTINGFGGCEKFLNSILMIGDYYIVNPVTEEEFKNIDFVDICFEYAGKMSRGYFA